MPSPPNFFFLRWIGLLDRKFRRREDNGGFDGIMEETPVSGSGECYACTQVGVPAFHSTTCDRSHPPEWCASAGSSLTGPDPTQITSRTRPRTPSRHILDPRSKHVQRLNRSFLLMRGLALAIDPLFFYALSIGKTQGPACLYMDGTFTAAVTMLRTCVDAVHLWHIWLQFRLAYVSRESLVVGCGKLVWDAHTIASHYLRSIKGFWFDLFVILPVPQAVFWLVVPKLIQEEKLQLIITILILILLFQFLPRVYHSICLMRKMQKVTGYIFGTIWWGFGLNLIAYFIASHVAGGCWYVLAIQRVALCIKQRCESPKTCIWRLSCKNEVCYQFLLPVGTVGNPCNDGNVTTAKRKPMCLDANGPFRHGIYAWALPAISSNSIAVKILYPIFWGLMTLSTFGNDLDPTSDLLEVIFSICMVLSGLLLFTLLIGNIQVFLHAVMAKKRKMQLRCRDIEWWMRRRQLPSRLRQRVRRFERQRWHSLGVEDELDLIRDLPQGLRRDIKRYVCVDLVKKVPLFHNMDDLILDNICDRAKPIVFSKDEKIIREGDPLQRMMFITSGRVKRTQSLSKGMVATSILEPGGYLGDELLSWCLRRPFIDRLPASSAMFVCTENIEAFTLSSGDLRYITDHFRYKFANERLKRTARYYSSNWRTWAAVNIQLAWHRYRKRAAEVNGGPKSPLPESGAGSEERRLLQYAAMFMSIRPHDHLE